MQIINTIAELRARLQSENQIAFVPTMGNLHEGHFALMREARQHGTCVVSSIFVNPLQFGPNEDFDRYPRTLAADCERIRKLTDVVFAPTVQEMYPSRQEIYVELPEIATELCGASRPGHFRGMATVVLKLLNIVQPQVALFGKKDYQQLHIIRALVTQFNLPIAIVGGETIRANDGLALSSRNQYLISAERAEAPRLYGSLRVIRDGLLAGYSLQSLQQEAVDVLTSHGWSVEYISVRQRVDLKPASEDARDLVILAAAKLGQTRLLDNLEVML